MFTDSRKITCHEQINSNRSKYYVPTKYESNSCISRPLFLKAFKFNLKVWVKFPKKLTLSSEELNFRRYGSTDYSTRKASFKGLSRSYDAILSGALCCNFRAVLLAITLVRRLLNANF